TFEASEKKIAEDAVCFIAEKSGGFPYLVQLLGYEVWESHKSKISLKDAKKGVAKAETYIGSSLIELIIQDLSPVDKEFVYGLAKIKTPAKIGALISRIGFDSNKLNQYRRRLNREGIVYSPERGYIDFVIPYMKEYLNAGA
ncbi:MAG: hypothetical protein LBG82_06550, partial [Clostridiales Family XIII bacterium]|nr:hypothetical protein [Clostridiales Family XIII bacterium]